MNVSADPVRYLGDGVSIEVRRLDGVMEGLAYLHPCLEGPSEWSWIPVRSPSGWTLVSEEPLTLTPSLLCPICKHHGFITGGAWVPA